MGPRGFSVASAIKGTLPPSIGIRIKPFTEELRARSFRTLDIFISTLAGEPGGRLPENFFVTLPKITTAEQVSALADIFDRIEPALGLPADTLRMEMMVETTQSIINQRGESNLPLLLEPRTRAMRVPRISGRMTTPRAARSRPRTSK